MQISDYWRFPRFNADTLLHEERHVLQACQAPLLLPKTLQSQEDFHSQVIFRHEVEAYHQETLYQKAVGIPPTSWLDELRTELEIPVIGPNEPFDIYQPLVDGLDEEGTVRLHADRAAHDIDMCCIRSLIKVRAPWLTRAFSRPQA